MLYDFATRKEITNADFLQHAQLTDSQLQVLQEAFKDPKHPLYWCCDFLALFLWSSYRLFQSSDVYIYCYGTHDPDAISSHKREMQSNSLIVNAHLKNIQNKKFNQL